MAKDAHAREIESVEEKCVGCLMCQMRCSYRFTKTFNPSRSQIEILRQPRGKREFTISFGDDCDACGLCAKHCTYGALGAWKK